MNSLLSTIGIPTSTETTNESAMSKLIISEVYFDGNDEFIEITNVWNKDFDWEITLVYWSKTLITSLQIEKKKSFVLSQADNSLTFWIIDTKAIEIILKQWDKELDSFFVEESEVKKLNDKKTSFEKKYENSELIIVPTIAERVKNISDGKVANPWYFEFWNEEHTSDIPTDTTNDIINDTSLVLTEALFDKENNWIEISNIWPNDYQGEIQILGFSQNKTITKTVQIIANSSIILAKNNKYLWDSLSLEITPIPAINRKENLNLQLVYWNKQDNLIVHKDRVKKIQGTLSSFEKIFIDNNRITTRTTLDRRSNIRGEFVANPGIYYTAWENIKDISHPIPTNDQNTPQNNADLCWNFIDRYRIEIKEIFGGNSVYPAFIELKMSDIPQPYSQLRLSGDVLSDEIILQAETDLREKEKTILISNSDVWENNGIDNIINQNFNLILGSWQLILEWFDGQDRQILDIIAVKELSQWQSMYSKGNKVHWCINLFEEKGDFSPWFDRKFLTFFKIDTEPKIEYIYVNKWGWGGGSYSCPTKADLCPMSTEPSKEKTDKKDEKSDSSENKKKDEQEIKHNDKVNDQDSLLYQVKIENIVYDPVGSDTKNEEITLLLTKGKQLDLKKTILVIDGKNKKISWTLIEGESLTLKGSFWFPNSKKDNSSVSVQIKIWDQALDTYYYSFPEKIDKQKEKATNKEWIKVFSILDGDTFRYKDENGKLQSVRLLWVDSPESNTARYRKTECYGKESKEYLTKLIKGKNIKIVFDENQNSTDNYWRLLAYVYLDDLFVNQHLIEQGFAREYTYKTAYQYQQTFKENQQQAQKNGFGMRNENHCPNNLKEEEVSKENSQNLILKITDINYDPKWTDKDKETIMLSSYVKTGNISSIDFTQQWWIFIFDSNENNWLTLEDLENGKGKFKDLSFLWTKTLESSMILTGTFDLPNTKSSCIALIQKDHLYDIACYTTKEEKVETQEDNITFYNSWDIQILSILPNPKGKDQWKEYIELISHLRGEINLESWFQLLINWKTKKKITGILQPWEAQKIIWNFNFSNDHSCISLIHQSQILDTFCYWKSEEWTVFMKWNKILEAINTEELEILKNVKFVKRNNQRCIAYENVLLKCRNIPRSKTDPFLKIQASMYRHAFSRFEKIIKENYTPLYYQTEFKELFDLVKKGKSDLNNKKTTTMIKGKEYSWSDFDTIYNKIKEPFWASGFFFLESILSPEVISLFQEKEQNWLNRLGKQNQ